MGAFTLKWFHVVSAFIWVTGGDVLAQTVMTVLQVNGNTHQISLASIDSITYSEFDPDGPPLLTTLPVGDVTPFSVVGGGDITLEGGGPITQRGLCWATDPMPTTADNLSEAGTGSGTFFTDVSGLLPGVTYFLRAFAVNASGTAYGNEVLFSTGSYTIGPGMVDQEGNTYPTIILDNGQEWMAENLRVATYLNNDPIPEPSNSEWDMGITYGAWGHYDNDPQYNIPYGKLYNWYAASDPRGVCPSGWHVPSDAEWIMLSDHFGGLQVTGGKVKATGTVFAGNGLWQAPNVGATNASGFTALPSGSRNGDGSYSSMGEHAGWWSTTTFGTPAVTAWARWVYYNAEYLSAIPYGYGVGLSIRCLRD